jgi:PPM family protein phosphatase
MECLSYGKTDVGRKRDHNEDYFLITQEMGIYIVCDGMGGHAAGEVASKLCAESVTYELKQNGQTLSKYREVPNDQNREQVKMLVHQAILNSCQKVFDEAQVDNSKAGMGTTLVLVLVVGNNAFVAHVGDSRVYLFRNSNIHQLTQDHSMVSEMVQQGTITKEQAKNHPYANVITRAIGIRPAVRPDILHLELMGGDKLLLCSDGLTAYMNKKILIEFFSKLPPKMLPEKLIGVANQRGGHDNITTVILDIQDAENPSCKEHNDLVSKKIATMRKIPLFDQFNYQQMMKILEIVTVKLYEAGDKIICEGEPGEQMYIILHGQAQVTIGGKKIRDMGSGDYFGEMALIDKSPRSASVTSLSKIKMLVLSRTPLFGLLQGDPRIAARIFWAFLQTMTKRLRDKH